MRCIMLWREALIHKRLAKILKHEELSEDINTHLKTLRNALSKLRRLYRKLTKILRMVM